MSKLVVLAVLVLTAVAAADTIRPGAVERVDRRAGSGAQPVNHPLASSGFLPAGGRIRTRVLLHGREYLSAAQIRAAFPDPLPGALFDIAHLAARGDGTLVLAIYGFPAGADPVDAIELWRDGRLESAFPVRPGTFGGGLGFADEGRLIATLSPDGSPIAWPRTRSRTASE